jgi:hypothetical protein
MERIPVQALIAFLKECNEPFESIELTLQTDFGLHVTDLLVLCELPTHRGPYPDAYDLKNIQSLDISISQPSIEDVEAIVLNGEYGGYSEQMAFTNICFKTINTCKFTITPYTITAMKYDPSILNNPGYQGVSKFVKYPRYVQPLEDQWDDEEFLEPLSSPTNNMGAIVFDIQTDY